MPRYSKAKGSSFATGPGRTFMAGSRSVFRGPGRTTARGSRSIGVNGSTAGITRRGGTGAGPRRTPAAENILLTSARGNAADGS